ncbi:hypothetical protein WMY93_024769 [Mugilogobius chulae]|uniref:Uncharacterized protein n=1 Tax=Mugilogobius chulae TaxID=88201 RepID=A0AAW0N4X6_9GOBI
MFYRNAGLEVDLGQTRVLSSVVLEAEDLDSDLDQVYYVLTTVPRQGRCRGRSASKCLRPIGSDWSVLDPGQNFTQTDVEMNAIRYVHEIKGHTEVLGSLRDQEVTTASGSFQRQNQQDSSADLLHSIRTTDRALFSSGLVLLESQRREAGSELGLSTGSGLWTSSDLSTRSQSLLVRGS